MRKKRHVNFRPYTLRRLLIFIFLFTCSILSLSQVSDPELAQFYHSSFEPIELNRDNFERLKTTYKEYIDANGNSSSFDEEKFVYEYNYFLDRINRSGNVFYGDEISAYVNLLKDKILVNNNLNTSIRVYVTDYIDLNAFTNDFGNIYINIATIAKIDSEIELMIILAHEIGHVLSHHSREKEFYSREVKKSIDINEDEDVFRIHSFSREKEIEADSIALQLLTGIASNEDFVKVFSKLEFSENPVLENSVQLSYLSPTNTEIHDFILNTFNSQLNLPKPLGQNNDSLSTHPSIQARMDFAKKEFEGKTLSTSSSHLNLNYMRMKLLSAKVLVNSYIMNGAYIEALYLILQLRQLSDSKYLLNQQSQVMTLLVQKKYSENLDDQIEVNFACSDTNFMQFKQSICAISKIDWNILTHDFHLNQLKGIDEKTNKSREEWAYQFLYDRNPLLFKSDSTGKTIGYELWSGELSKSKWLHSTFESKELKTVIDSLGFSKNMYAQAGDSSILLKAFLSNSEFSEKETAYIEAYKKKILLRENNIVTNASEFMHPALAADVYHRGVFVKAKSFEPSKKTVLIQSDNLFFDSKDLKQYNFNYKKSLKLNSQLEDLSERYNSFSADYSLSSVGKTSVLDNYLHKLIMTWIFENGGSSKLHYSRVEDEIQKYLHSENVDYIAYRLSILNRNRGSGRKFNLNYYELYFDAKSGGVVYFAKIGSKQFPDRFQIEQMVFLSELNKKAK